MSVLNFFPGVSSGYGQVPAATVDAGVNLGTWIAANIAGFTTELVTSGGPWKVFIRPQTQGFRWRDDGTAATAAVGFPVAVDEVLVYDMDKLESLTVISQVAGCILNVFIERQRA